MFSKYDWYETIGIALAVMLASLIATISEYGADAAFKKLSEEQKNMAYDYAKLLE